MVNGLDKRRNMVYNTDMELGKLLTTQQVCQLLQVTKRTLRRWEKIGYIKTIRLPNGQRRIVLSEVARLARGELDS